MSLESRKIRTFSGLLVSPLKPEAVSILDVAHGLAGLRRYNAQSPLRYTVAQHSVDVMHRVRVKLSPNLALRPRPETLRVMREALLHDAHEAYCGDITSPVKKLLPALAAAEKECAAHVRQKLGLPYSLNPVVKECDVESYYEELERLWRPDDGTGFKVWDSDRAKSEFLDAYYNITHAIERADRKVAALG